MGKQGRNECKDCWWCDGEPWRTGRACYIRALAAKAHSTRAACLRGRLFFPGGQVKELWFSRATVQLFRRTSTLGGCPLHYHAGRLGCDEGSSGCGAQRANSRRAARGSHSAWAINTKFQPCCSKPLVARHRPMRPSALPRQDARISGHSCSALSLSLSALSTCAACLASTQALVRRLLCACCCFCDA